MATARKDKFLIIRQRKDAKGMFDAEVYVVESEAEGKKRLEHESKDFRNKYVAFVKVLSEVDKSVKEKDPDPTPSLQELATRDKSFTTTGQTWSTLRKAWKQYRIGKVQGDVPKMKENARKIREIQTRLDVSIASFPHLGPEFT